MVLFEGFYPYFENLLDDQHSKISIGSLLFLHCKQNDFQNRPLVKNKSEGTSSLTLVLWNTRLW